MQKIRPDFDIGNNIQKARRNKGLTQEQVVARMQVMGFPITRSTYAKIETNRSNIRVSELVALKAMFDVEFSDFFIDLDISKFSDKE